MLLLPVATARTPSLSRLAVAPPATRPTLKVRLGSGSSRRKRDRMRASSNTAPSPTPAEKMPDEWPVRPVVVSVQPFDERRATEPISRPFSITRPSKSSAASARLPAASRSARATAVGSPASSSSPVRTISMLASFSVPAACIARSAASIVTMPPLSSPAPGPSASSPRRTNFWNGESASNTVSRWPMRRRRFVPGLPRWTAIRWPARLTAAIGFHVTWKPSGSSSARIIRPTASTPGRLSVPLFWSTSRWSSAIERGCSASTVRTIVASAGESAGAAARRRAAIIVELRVGRTHHRDARAARQAPRLRRGRTPV